MTTQRTEARKLILGTAGHIDHGKTALVRALTGIDTDRLPEEKQRGLTIDIGFARLDLDEFDLGIVDVPGHERFIRNMLAGATGIDLAMLVIAADDAVMPQTREHLEILRLLGIPYGVISITKCDLAADDLLELVEQDVRDLAADTFLRDAPIVRTSAATGMGIDDLKATLTGVCRRIQPTEPGRLFRLAVDRSFVVHGHGTVVTGSVASGSVRVGDEIEWLPLQKTLRVRSLESHGRSTTSVHRGQRAAIGLAGVHHRQIMRSHELATSGYLKPTRLMTVAMKLSWSSPWPVKHRSKIRVHIGTAECVATVSLSTGGVLKRGQSTTAQLAMGEPVLAVCGQPFVIRSLSPAVTLGGGHVLQPLAGRIPRKDTEAFGRAGLFGSPSPIDRTGAAIRSYGTLPWTEIDLCRDADLDLEQVKQTVKGLQKDEIVIVLATGPSRSLYLHREIFDDLAKRVDQTLRHYHAHQPLRLGIPRRLLLERTRMTQDETTFAAILARMVDQGQLSVHGEHVAMAGFVPKLTAQEQTFLDNLIEAFRAAGFHPPSLSDLARNHGLSEDAARPTVDLAVSQDQLKHLGSGLYLHCEFEREMRRRLSQELRKKPGLTMSEIRQLLDTSRRFAVPFCEYLDRIGFTQRRGDQRVLVADREALTAEAEP